MSSSSCGEVCFAAKTQMFFSLITKIIKAEQLLSSLHFPCHEEIPYNTPKTYISPFLVLLIHAYFDKVFIFQITP